jgi:hypothetical protein
MESTAILWTALNGEVLCGKEVCGYSNVVIVDAHQDTDDGTFPTLASYTRAVNRIEKEGITSWINSMTKKKSKLVIDFWDFKIIRDHADSTEAVIEFEEPIEVELGKIGDRLCTAQVKRMRGEFFHEYFWTKHGRQSKRANGFEILFSIKEYLE